MNSVLQVLWSLKETGERYLPHADAVFGSAPRDVPADLLSQWCKVGRALVLAKTGDVRRGEDGELKEADAVRPGMFKALVGRGHPEFSSNRQQVRLSVRREQRTAFCGWDRPPNWRGGRRG